jgi:SpoVK/Ycf46/Vps4 family AAA+-type ATPase
VPKTDQLLKMFQAIAASDLQRSRDIAMQICADEERKGHLTAARLLRGALSNARRNNGTSLATPAQSALPVSSALARVQKSVRLSEVELKTKWRQALTELVDEWKQKDRLIARDLHPRNRIFFYGPPGCGKSLAACALGNELALPTFIVRFDAIIGAYLGQTAIHLRQLFNYAEMTPCVLVLDELDALGKKRGNPLDVGELDRIVIALMQELEHADPKGLIVATSNLPKHIDDALWRRFDLVIEFPRPTARELTKYAKRLANSFNVRITPQLSRELQKSQSYAECRKTIEVQARRDALSD